MRSDTCKKEVGSRGRVRMQNERREVSNMSCGVRSLRAVELLAQYNNPQLFFHHRRSKKRLNLSICQQFQSICEFFLHARSHCHAHYRGNLLDKLKIPKSDKRFLQEACQTTTEYKARRRAVNQYYGSSEKPLLFSHVCAAADNQHWRSARRP